MPAPTILLEFLENSGLLIGDRIDEKRVRRLSAARLSDLGAEAAALTDVNSIAPRPGALTHSATLALGGSSDPCASVACRTRHIDQLVPFAAFYSDRVYIHNFFGDHQHWEPDDEHSVLEDRRQALFSDLSVIRRVRPLIEAGLIEPVTATGDRCPQCVALAVFGPGADKRLKSERERLAKQFFKAMSVSLEYLGDGWAIDCKGPESLFEHGGRFMTYKAPPDPLDRMPALLRRAASGELVDLSATVRRRLGFHTDAASDVVGNVVFEMAVAKVLGTSYLSDTALPLEVLSAVGGDRELARRNSLIQRHLTSFVPFLADVSAQDVLTLRNREAEAFQIYRQALNKAVDEVRTERSSFREQDARALYSDVVAPGLARVDRAVKNAKRDLLKTAARSALGWTGAISFGVYAGFVPPQLQLAATAIGATKVLADLGGTLSGLIVPDSSARADDFYFLWRVRKLARRRSSTE